jgi:hypothetical protein
MITSTLPPSASAVPTAQQVPNPTAIVGPPPIHHGILNASHTSSVALVYLTSTLPTPWPFYLASMGFSLLMVLMALVICRYVDRLESVFRWAHLALVGDGGYCPVELTATVSPTPKTNEAAHESAWRRVRKVVLHMPLLINSARTAGTLSLAVRVVQQHGDARRPPVSTILALLLSLLPNLNSSHSHLACGLAAADMLVLIVSAVIVAFVDASSNPAVSYGDLAGLSGAGGCPLNVAADELHSDYVGCCLDTVGKYRNAFEGGSISDAEWCFTLFPAIIYACIALVALCCVLEELAVACGFILSLCGRARRYPFRPINSSNDNDPDTSNASSGRLEDVGADDITLQDFATDAGATAARSDSRGPEVAKSKPCHLTDAETATLCGGVIFLIILCTVILFPIYYVQQTRPVTYTVFDSVGPLTRGSDRSPAALNGTIWSDWFYVAKPVDQFGFMAAWWREHGGHWDTLLAYL